MLEPNGAVPRCLAMRHLDTADSPLGFFDRRTYIRETVFRCDFGRSFLLATAFQQEYNQLRRSLSGHIMVAMNDNEVI